MRRAGVLALLTAGIVVFAIAFLLIVNALSGGEETDCSRFSVKPGQWQAASPDERADLQRDMNSCGTLEGMTEALVTALLGPPDARAPSGGGGALIYGFGDRAGRAMEVRLERGRVTGQTRLGALPLP